MIISIRDELKKSVIQIYIVLEWPQFDSLQPL